MRAPCRRPVVEAAPVAAPATSVPVTEAAPVAQPAVEAPITATAEPSAEPVVPPTAAEGAPSEVLAAEPAAAEPVTEAAPAEPTTEAAPAEPAPLTFTEFKMPEGIKAEPKQIEAFTELLGKVDPRTQEGAQALLDLHAASLKEFAETYAKDAAQKQQDVFAETRKTWVDDFYKQAGNKRDTILNDAKWAIGDIFKNADERKSFTDLLAYTGAGDHPAMIMALSKVAKRLRERTAPPQGLAARAEPSNPADKRYGAAPRR